MLTVEEIIARHQQQQRTQDALVRSYIADARMDQHFRPDDDRSGLRRGERQPLLRLGIGCGVGGAVVFREWHEVGARTVPRSRCSRRRRCCRCRCSSASTTTTAIGSPARNASASTTATWSDSIRSGRASRSTGGRSGSIGALSHASRYRRSRPRCRRRSCPTRRSRPTRRWRRSATGRSSCSPASPRGRSCSSPGATCSSRRASCSPTSA